jgi:NAD(P)-dependent dehydrogenase (short-subunit alcohol dehydrogenase family)
MNKEFPGKSVWVVGASGGLGSAIAQAFLHAGASVALSGRSADKLKNVVAGHPEAGKALLLPIDITSPAEVDDAAAKIVKQFGTIDVLVNSTAVATFGNFLELDDAAWREVYEAKLFAYARTMRAVLPHMLQQQRGAIVNVSGNGGKYPHFSSHIVGSSGNAAVNLMTKAVSDLYVGHGIRVNCVAPGAIRSPRLESISSADEAIKSDAGGGSSAAAVLEKKWRPGEAADIADATLFLASDRAKHINGIVLTVDGGATPTT